ncbi:HDL329Wp [Eremothecium sinecaudum]|uniref:HDL329Wp n=1 Tax=Eremothecium sinecaudum TaxID=45286 RepID=A0A120K247_9SACH|nr:HDL329Wp [Eremothecium sinecaudum]AMD20415.1 HDL329Wp [Eremothecium sinecaudum]
MKIWHLFASVLVSSAIVEAYKEGYKRKSESSYIPFACKAAVTFTAKFCEKDNVKSYACQCKNPHALASYLNCGYKNTEHDAQARKDFEMAFIKSCVRSNVTLTREQLQKAYEDAKDNLVHVHDIPDFNKAVPVSVPVHYNSSEYLNAFRSSKVKQRNLDDSMAMGGVLIAYWGFILLLGTLANVIRSIMPNIWLAGKRRVCALYPIRRYREFVSLASITDGKHTSATRLYGYLPTRLESIIAFIFVFLTLIFHCVRYEGFVYREWTKSNRISFSIGDRAGILAGFLCVLTWMLAGRSNIFLFLTGWKQSVFLTYHKWIARLTVASVLVHTGAMFTQTLVTNKYQRRSHTYWWRWGSLAMVAGGVMIIQGMAYLRHRWYEVFLYFHILLAVAFLAGAWVHTREFGYARWYHICAFLWLLDRVSRLGRIAFFGVRQAEVRIVSDETLEVLVPRRKWWKNYPGSIAYVYFVGSPLFFQSHPFTLVTGDDSSHVKFFIKKKNGATNSIYQKLLKKPDQSMKLRVAVEGPYGNHYPLYHYDTVLLYAGGNGIPGPFTYAEQLGRRGLTSKTAYVKLYWVVRNYATISWFLEELKRLAPFRNVQIIIYVTRPEGPVIGDSSSGTSKEEHINNDDDNNDDDRQDDKHSQEITAIKLNSILPDLPSSVEIRHGRPPMREVIHSDLDEASGLNIAVMACAHNQMVDEVRNITAYETGHRKEGQIDYYEELQVW